MGKSWVRCNPTIKRACPCLGVVRVPRVTASGNGEVPQGLRPFPGGSPGAVAPRRRSEAGGAGLGGSASYKYTPRAGHAGGLNGWRASTVLSLSSPAPAGGTAGVRLTGRHLALEPTGGGHPGREREGVQSEAPIPPYRSSSPLARAGGVYGAREGAEAAGTKAIGPEPPRPPPPPSARDLASASRAPARLGSFSGSARPLAGPRPAPAYLLLPGPAPPSLPPALPPSAGCRSPGLGADGTAAMFASRLLDFQKTKYAR